ncbi:MAG: hypothetical protein IJO94_02810 [Firmicutes bacterium]|nr:hypothetical protein [Bacillota bacterium]
MNPLLNGTAWGELEPKEKEVQIPEFLVNYTTTQGVVVPYSAYRAQGRVKRQVRAEKKQRRDFINIMFYCGVAFALLAFAELICR